ncbi:MAG: hypothetical protein ACOZNI_29305 [Myxococcota bacterium]
MILALLLAACGSDDPCEGVRDLTASPMGLELTEAEHPSGWGRTECFQCHQAWKVHADDCLDEVAFDGGKIEAEAPAGCVACHGHNGVEASDTGGAE